MQPAQFRYTLTIDSVDYNLLNAPEGWEETFLKNARSTDYWGLIRSFTMPLKFVLDGAYLLRKEFYTKGIPAQAVLKVEVLENKTWKYRTVYSGEIDFTEIEDTSVGNSVTVRATDVGIAEMIASFDKAVYEIELTDENSVLVEIPGISLIDSAQLLVLPQAYPYPDAGRLILPCDVEENELVNEKIETKISNQEINPNLANSENWIVRCIEDTTVTISGVVEAVFGTSNDGARCYIEIINNSGVLRGTIVNVGGIRGGKIDYSMTIDVSSGERLFLTLRKSGNTSNLFQCNYFPVKIQNEIFTDPSKAKAIKAEELFKTLLTRMNGGDGGAKSDLLRGSNLFITCGDAIRGFEKPVIKTSFQDFYRTMDYVMNAGFGIDLVPRLETKEFFFRDSVCLDLGEVKEFSLKVETNLLYNTLKNGYKAQKYEKDQGREEYNQGQVWTNSNRKTDTTMDRVAPYRADQYGIAVLRTLTILDNLKGVDTESDNDVWILQGSGEEIEGVQKLEIGADLDYVTGIPNPDTAINLRLSPKNNMIRSGSFLSVGLKGYDDTNMVFASSDRNADLITQIDGKIVAEKQPIAVMALGKRLFLPYIGKVKAALPVGAWALIDANRYGYMKWKFEGNDYRGFLKEGDTDLAQNSEREFNLYLHADTNLNALIR